MKNKLDVKAYISSGILETYVLGVCSAEESAQVELYMQSYPEIREEVEAIRDSLNMYGASFSKQPPAHLKAQIKNVVLTQEDKTQKGNVIPMHKVRKETSSPSAKWLAAASISLFLIASAINVFLYLKWKSAENQLAEIAAEKEYLADQFEINTTNLEQLKEELNFIQQPNTRTVFMKGVEQHPQALATVFWNEGSNEVYLRVNNLPEAPQGKQYQLWAIVDGQPVNAGMVESDSSRWQQMNKFASAQAFAITLEVAGGSPTPNLEAMYVIGNI